MGTRQRVLGLGATIIGLALATCSVQQTASLALVEEAWNGVEPGRATLFALLVAAGVILGSALVAAGGIETLRGVRWWRRGLIVGGLVTFIGWASIPLTFDRLRSIEQADAHDAMRFVHSLRFSGDLSGDLTNARFVLTIAGRERTCEVSRGRFSLWQVRGRVGSEDVTLWISITPYTGPGTYRARHEYGKGVANEGEAELIIERDSNRDWYARSGTLIVNADERSGRIDQIAGAPPWEPYAPPGQTHVIGAWQCAPGTPRA